MLCGQDACPIRGAQLRRSVETRVSNFVWYEGIVGLTLQLDLLKRLGAKPELLKAWTEGWDLQATPAPPRNYHNHPSLRQRGVG